MPAHKLDLSKREKYIPADVLKRIYETVDKLRDLAYIQYHAETGLRVSEVLGTRLSDINWEKRKTNTFDFKKDSWRMVFWPPFVGSTLKMYLNNRDKSKETRDQRERLFPFSEKTANRILKRWCEIVEFKHADKVSSHWLRHTFIRLSRRANRDIKFVQQNTGDTMATILEWYDGLTDEEIENEVEKKPLIN